MTKPVINKITPFDATKDENITIKFNYIGNQPNKNIIKIYLSTDLTTPVYSHLQETMRLENTFNISNAGLINGRQYAIEVVVYSDDVESPTSDKSFFWCLAEPDFYFVGLDDDEVNEIKNSSINLTLYYEQEQWDDLLQYQFFLYDYRGSLLSSSEIKYDIVNMNHVFKGLDNGITYYVEAVGITQKEISVKTKRVELFVNYEIPTAYSRIYAESNNGDGIVNYYTNIKVIEAERDNYEYDGSYILLENDTIIYNQQFTVPDNFIMAIRHKFNGEKLLLSCGNNIRSFELSVIDCTDGLYRYKLKVPNSFANYVLYSEPFSGDPLIVMTCWIIRINDLYQLVVYEEQLSTIEYNLWLGSSRPLSGLTQFDVWIDEDGETSRIEKDDVVIWYQNSEPEEITEDNIWIGGNIE